jgi:hypothetical protein
MLKSIAIVTLVVRSIAGVEPAYEQQLHYEAVERGHVSRALAKAWDAPAMAGRDFVVLRPASGEPVYLRIVEAAKGTPAVEPFRTTGWNSTEILVQDPDALAKALDGTAFRVIGQPRNLTAAENAPRAMQALGPANEPLYMTRFIVGASGLDLGSARTPVDRVFITVVGGTDLDALRAFYGGKLGLPLTEFGQWPIPVIAKAWSLPPETKFALTGAALPKDFMIEMDDYPDAAPARKRARGALPGGWAMVSFTVERLADVGVEWRSRPRSLKDFPYDGRKVAVTVGPAGEWLELIETASSSAPAMPPPGSAPN